MLWSISSMNHIAIIYLWNLTFTVQAVLKRKILLKYRNTNLISRKSIFRKVHLLFSRLKCQFLRQNQPLKDSRIMTNPRNVLKTIVKQEFFANFQPFLFLQFLTINSSDIIADILSKFPPIVWRAFWFYEKNLVFISSMLLCLYIYMIKHILALWMLRPLQR